MRKHVARVARRVPLPPNPSLPIAYKPRRIRDNPGAIIGSCAAIIFSIYLQKIFIADRYAEENRKFSEELRIARELRDQ